MALRAVATVLATICFFLAFRHLAFAEVFLFIGVMPLFAALLAGMIPSANNRYNPITRPDSALARRNKVLDRMLELDMIDAEAHAAAVGEPLGVELHREQVDTGAYFLEMVRKEIEQRYGTDALYTGGLEVHLTMDPELQRLAETVVRDGLVDLTRYITYPRPPPSFGALAQRSPLLRLICQPVGDDIAATFIDVTDSRPVPGIDWRLEVDRQQAARFGTDISTPAGRRAAALHFHLTDHALLRVLWTNFYPVAPLSADDGVARIVMGLGRGIPEGELSLRFSPVG